MFAMNALLWLYTGIGVFELDSKTSSDVRIYSIARQLIALALLIIVFKTKGVAWCIKYTYPALIVFVFYAISISWSEYKTDSTRAVISFSMQYLIACALCVNVCVDKALDRFISICSGLIVFTLVFSLAFPGFVFDSGGFGGVYSGAFRGILAGKNVFGVLLSSLFIAVVTSLYVEGKIVLTVKKLSLIAICVSFAAISQSMTTILTMMFCVFGLLFIVTISRLKTSIDRLIVVLFSLISISLFMCCVIFLLDGETIGSFGRELTLTGRTTIWEYVIHESQRPILGYGFAGFWQPYVGTEGLLERTGLWAIGQAHNGFLEAYLFGGVTGLILVLLFWLYLFTGVIWLITNFPRERATLFSVLTIIVAFLQNQTESNFPNQFKITGVMLTLVVIFVRSFQFNKEAKASS